MGGAGPRPRTAPAPTRCRVVPRGKGCWCLLLGLIWTSLAAFTTTSGAKRLPDDSVPRRRCLGRFLANVTSHHHTTEGDAFHRNESSSLLHWLSHSTVCQGEPSPPETPPASSWRRSKKPPLERSSAEADASGSNDKHAEKTTEPPYHVVLLLLEDQPIVHEIVTLSAGFLVAGLNVTLIAMAWDTADNEAERNATHWAQNLRSQIIQRLPLPLLDDGAKNPSRAVPESFRLVVTSLREHAHEPLDMERCRSQPAPSHPLEPCAMDLGPSVWNLLQHELGGAETAGAPGDGMVLVLVLDAGLWGGLLYAEAHKIPTVAIGSHRSLPLVVEHEPRWAPSLHRSALDRLDRTFLQRLSSLGLTGNLRRANRIRKTLGRKAWNRPLDHLLPVVAFLVDLLPMSGSSSSDTSTLPMGPPSTPRHSGGPNESLERQPDNGSREDVHSSQLPSYGYRVHNLQPLLAPCQPCWDPPSSSSSMPTAKHSFDPAVVKILVAPAAAARASAQWTRSLIRALVLAKQSLARYDDCLFDRATCHNGVAGFEVEWLVTDDDDKAIDRFPPVVPPFIHRERSASPLDMAVRHPGAILALVHCDQESNVLVSLGIEVVCLTQSDRIPSFDAVADLWHEKRRSASWDGSRYTTQHEEDSLSRLLRESLQGEPLDPHEVATQLLSVLRRHSLTSNTAEPTTPEWVAQRNREVASWLTSGLERAVTIVQTAARTHREHHHRWENVRDMQRVTSRAITEALRSLDGIPPGPSSEDFLQSEPESLHDVLTLSLAWLVFLLTTIYILVKDSVAIKRWQQYRHHHWQRRNLLEGIVNRLTDLDDACEILSSWWKDLHRTSLRLSAHGDPDDRERRPGSDEPNPTSTRKEHHAQQTAHHGNVRRRRKMKAK